MTVHTRQINRALAQIAKKGKSVIWREIVDSVPDPTKPFLPTNGTPVDHPVKIVFLPYDLKTQRSIAALAGTEVQTGAFYGLMGSVDFVPNLKGVVVNVTSSGWGFDWGNDWGGIEDLKQITVKTIDVLEPNGTPILYTIGFEK